MVASPARAVSIPRETITWRALVPALAVPVIFLHVKYQPKATVGLRSTTVGISPLQFDVQPGIAAGAVADPEIEIAAPGEKPEGRSG